jgi:hypothetical protein
LLEDFEKKLQWIFLLLPGFLCLFVVGQIVALGALDEFQIVFYLVLLNMIIWAATTPLVYGTASLIARVFPHIQMSSVLMPMLSVFVLIASVGLGVVIGLAAEGDTLFRALRAAPITDTLNKVSAKRPLVFILSQNSVGKLKELGDARKPEKKQTEGWAQVAMKSGRVYEGWPEYYTITEEAGEIWLSPACERQAGDGEHSVRRIPGPGILVVEREIESVALLDRSDSECFAAWAK